MVSKEWSDEELKTLTKMYGYDSKEALLKALPTRTWKAIGNKGSLLCLARTKTKTDLRCLLEDTPEAAYWVGFIAADGYFKNNKALTVLQLNDNADHVSKLGIFLKNPNSVKTSEIYPSAGSYNNSSTLVKQSRLDVSSNSLIPLITEKFDFRERKTYNPPRKLPYEDEDLLKCWLIGFIDGDGYIGTRNEKIKPTSYFRISCHLSWYDYMVMYSNKFPFLISRITTSSSKSNPYSLLSCYRHNEMVKLKALALEHNLPIMEKKWDKVDCNLIVNEKPTSYVLHNSLSEQQIADLLSKGEG